MDNNRTKAEADALTINLTFQIAGKEQSFSHKIALPYAPADGGVLNLVNQTFVELEKEIHFSRFHEELPTPNILSENRVVTPEEWNSDERVLLLNTQEVWREIANTLLSAQFLLAQSRAYKETEQWLIDQGVNHRSHDVLNIHISKMTAFDGGVYRLAKIEDLFLLLLFVNLGNSLVDTDIQASGWEKKLVWTAVRDGLRRRRPEAVSNRYLNALSDADYSSIISIFKKFKDADEGGIIAAYRDATTHRIPPSVDYSGFSAKLIFAKSPVSQGEHEMMRFTRRFSVDYDFSELYAKAVKVFSHYVKVLRELRTVRRFA